MSLDAQRIIDVIRQAISQMTNNGAEREFRYGYTTTGGAYQVSAYINDSETVSDYINVPAGLYVPVGSYVETVRIEDEVEVVRSMPTLFSRIAFDWINGRIRTGSGSVEPADTGTSGQYLVSGGSGGAVSWVTLGGGSSASASTPAAVSTAGAVGSDPGYSRGDHVHAHEAAHINHDTTWAAKGDIIAGTANDTAQVLTAGANDTILMADSGQTTGLKWVASATPSTQAFGDAAAVGTADTFTRGDHVHGMPADPKTFGLVLASNEVFSANTFSDLTGMSFPVVNGKSYNIQLFLAYESANVGAGPVLAFNHPGGTARAYAEYHGGASAVGHTDEWVNGGVDSGTGLTSVNAATTIYGIEYVLWYTCTSNGTFTFRRRRTGGTSANITIYAGSGGTVAVN